MAEQEVLYSGEVKFNPEQHGVWRRYQSNQGFTFNTAALARSRAIGESVGSCRTCGGALHVQPTPGHGTTGAAVEFIDFICTDCGHEASSPAGRRLERSSRHNRMPAGWMGRRFTAMKTLTPQTIAE